MKSQPVFQIILFLRRPGETSLADIIKIAVMLTKTTLKDKMRIIKKKKKRENFIKMQYLSVLLTITKITNIWWKNTDVNKTQVV